MDSLKVLVVDDEQGMREGVRRALAELVIEIPEERRSFGLELRTAATGHEGLELIASWEPDLLLLDYKLPDISGLDILRSLAGEDRDLLTIMITAYATLQTAITATRRGAFDFLAKPYNPGELRAVVTKAAQHLLLQRRARALAEERQRVRFDFVRVLAHELKSPLASVEGFLYLMRDGLMRDKPELEREAVLRSIEKLGGMRKLIVDLLDMTHLESGTRKRHLDELDLSTLCEHTLGDFAPQAREAEVELHLHAEAGIVLQGDREELGIVLNNLLSNAIKYNRPGGRVDLWVEDGGACVRLRVRDTGIGMREEDRQRIFGEFVRVKSERTREIQGSGLGLSILRKVVDLYRGEIRVESELDVGSTFEVTLARDGGVREAA
jgi:two-component system sensor histidine kinase/response regulator